MSDDAGISRIAPSAYDIGVPPLLIGWLSHAHCDPRPIPAVPGAWASRHFRPMALAVEGESRRSSALRAIYQSRLNSRQTDRPWSSFKLAVTVRDRSEERRVGKEVE